MPAAIPLSFSLLPQRFVVARLAADAAIPPALLTAPGLVSITRTAEELSLVCAENIAPDLPQAVAGWRCLMLHGPFAFDQVGILAALLQSLAAAGVGIFALSTFDTDYLLVQAEQLAPALAALQEAGHRLLP